MVGGHLQSAVYDRVREGLREALRDTGSTEGILLYVGGRQLSSGYMLDVSMKYGVQDAPIWSGHCVPVPYERSRITVGDEELSIEGLAHHDSGILQTVLGFACEKLSQFGVSARVQADLPGLRCLRVIPGSV
ncbi:hypothetical protein GF342_01015 [Candidatus Woesearchaeota archaeon]|nr:hypothetical protein [Candidatus Woesearchaeota archaeon]